MNNVYKEIMDALEVSENNLGEALAKRRMVPMFGEINSGMAEGLSKVLVTMDMRAIEPITIIIGSNGGNVEQGEHICDIIHTLNSPVDGLVIGNCGSMALRVLLHCRQRLALPSAQFFIHHCRSSIKIVEDDEEITASEMMEIVQMKVEAKRRRDEFYAKRIGKSVEEVQKLQKRGEKYELHYSAPDALNLGLIDKIVTDFKWWK